MVLTDSRIVGHPGITLPITTEFRQIAQTFAQQCPIPEKALQIKQNTLAVCAVNAYLTLMDIETNVEESDSWNPMMQVMANVADLKVPNVGVFSCRPIPMPGGPDNVPANTTCHIPPEDWHHRAGYIAVALKEEANEATLVGFIPTANESEEIPIEQFAPIEALIDRVYSLRTSAAASSVAVESTESSLSATVTQLSDWAIATVSEGINTGWQAISELISPGELNFAFRNGESAQNSAANIGRARLVDLGLQLGHSLQVALVIQLTPVSERQIDMMIQVRPFGNDTRLPEGIVLSVLDENGDLFRSATSRAIDDYIQLPIIGEPGETFSVEITKGNVTFSEQFVI